MFSVMLRSYTWKLFYYIILYYIILYYIILYYITLHHILLNIYPYFQAERTASNKSKPPVPTLMSPFSQLMGNLCIAKVPPRLLNPFVDGALSIAS